jgi:hypothetical protein
MNGPLEPGSHLLLRVCANPDADISAFAAPLDPHQWRDLVETTFAHRLAPLLLRSLERSAATHLVPPDVLKEVTGERNWWVLYAMRQATGVRRVLAVLKAGGFVPLALKGLPLARMVYPDPALRPLRDVDLLFPPTEAVRAQQYLLRQPEYEQGREAGDFGIEFNHQLPEIHDPTTGLNIEIHHRINARGWREEPLLVSRLQTQVEAISVLGESVRVPSAQVNLLHLVEHATLHHTFENGPTVLADLHFMFATQPLDWTVIVRDCEELGLTRALGLVTAVARQFGAGWPSVLGTELPSATTDQVLAACVAMLQNREYAEQLKLLRRLGAEGRSGWGPAAALASALRPHPVILAQMAGTSPQDWRRWRAYPAWLANRAKRYHNAHSSDVGLARLRDQLELEAWLRG